MRINAKKGYRLSADWTISPSKDVQKRGKLLVYLLKSETFDYQIIYHCVAEFYEADESVLKQVMESFTSL